MKTIYLDCSMGAAGDMLTAALLELHAQPEAVLDTLNRAFDGKAVLSSQSTGRWRARNIRTATAPGTIVNTPRTAVTFMSTNITTTMITRTLRSPLLPQGVPARHITTITIPPSPRSGSLSEGSTFPRM